MVLRSWLCYKKFHASSQKQTISLYIKQQTQQQRNISYKSTFVRNKYPGSLLHYPYQQQCMLTASVNSTGKQLEKLDLKSTLTTSPIRAQHLLLFENNKKDLDRVLNNKFTIKQTIAFYCRLAKTTTSNDIYKLFSAKLETIEYQQLWGVLKDAATYWPVETIHDIISLCDGKYVKWRLDLLNLLLSSYVLDRNLESLLGTLPTSSPTSSREHILPFYNAVLSKCLKQREYKHLQQVVDLMMERGIGPDAASFNILIRMKLVDDKTTLQPEEKFAMYKSMISQGIKPNNATFNTFIKHACQHQQWDTLKTWLDMMEEDLIGPNTVTARILFRSYVGNPANAELSSAFERVSTAIPITEKEKFLNTGVAALLKVGQTKAAMDILDKTFTLDQPLSVYSYNLLIRALCLDGQTESAQQVLDSMISQNEDKNKDTIPKPDIVSFTTLIHGLVRNSDQVELNQLNAIYKQLMEQGLSANNVLNSVILYALIRSDNSNNLSKVRSMFESVMADKDKVKLPRQHADTSLYEINIYNMMMDFYFLYYHHSNTLRHQTPQEPFALLKDAIEDKKLKPTVSTLNILVRGLAILNKDLNAAETMVALLEEKGIQMDEKTVWYLTKSAYSQGQISRARKWIDAYESQDKSIKGSGLNHLKSILTQWDKKEDDVLKEKIV